MLDPEDWEAFRAQAHRALDEILDYTRDIRDRPVWRPVPDAVRAGLDTSMPRRPEGLAAACDEFRRAILPFATGNVHPGFMGWVHGGGNPAGIVGEMLAAGLNANLGGRDHAPILVERQVIGWMAELFGLPDTAGGLLVTGTSIANLIAVLIARRQADHAVRERGTRGSPLVAYASAAAHGCVARAMDMAGLGTDALRLIATDEAGRMRAPELAEAITCDREAGLRPFLVVGTAGSVNIGAIDDLPGLAALCRREGLWFHIDGAFGALAALSPTLRPLLWGIERADSIAFDFHKWGQVPYDAGCILVRERAHAEQAFAAPAAYLRREARGLAGGAPWPCDLGPDLSRGFRALKIWFTVKTWGADAIGASILHCCEVARHLAALVDAAPMLERMAPVALNIVCFRYRFGLDSDRQNAELVADLQESGIVAPSTTTLGGRLAIRAAIVNHRTRREDVDALIAAVREIGTRRARNLVQGRGTFT
ncbi:MAG TPA: pyridoxal-dependent decarboxylase [Acetobacteraceae bacterium]|nr:pyridoxal-dependent decarboxylase [Acetobacteraceae bacterium]